MRGASPQERNLSGVKESVILVGIGSNLGNSIEICRAAVERLDAHEEVEVIRVSRWFQTAPVPVSDQPWYVNGVAALEAKLPPERLLQLLHAIEADAGRVRRERNEARVLDLDLLAYHDEVLLSGNLLLPHPRIAERAFVLHPLMDIAPSWRHPVTGKTVMTMLKELPTGQEIEVLAL